MLRKSTIRLAHALALQYYVRVQYCFPDLFPSAYHMKTLASPELYLQ